MKLTGAYSALVTPFDQQGQIDIESYRHFIRFQLDSGISGLVPCGTTGESPTLTSKEKRTLIQTAIQEANGVVPVIAGTGTNNTAYTIEATKWAYETGATAALVITPYYNKPGQEGLFRHFAAVAEAVPGIQIVIYNVPGRTNVNILPETVERLVSQYENIRTIKEASGDLGQILELQRRCGDELTILSGEDGLIVPYMASGAKGVISVVSNVMPSQTERLCRYMLEGKGEEALQLQQAMNPFIDLLFVETNPIPVKFALGLLGFRMGDPRLPLHPFSERWRGPLRKAMEQLDITLKTEEA